MGLASVISSNPLSSRDTWDQRVKVGSDHPRHRGYYLPVKNFTQFRWHEPHDIYMSVCLLRLKIPSREPFLRFPSSQNSQGQGQRLVWFGFGSRNYDIPYHLERMTCSQASTTLEIDRCRHLVPSGILPSDYCVNSNMGTRMSMTQLDNGGPLVHPESKVVWGVGVTLIPDFNNKRPDREQLFVGLAPLRSEILKAMKDMDGY